MSAHPSQGNNFEIRFSSYADFSYALGLSNAIKKSGLYKESRFKKPTAIRVAQVIGSLRRLPNTTTSAVLVGSSKSDAKSCPFYLYHDEPVFGNRDWSAGCELRDTLSDGELSQAFRPEKDINAGDRQFCIRWERKKVRAHCVGVVPAARNTLGTARAFLPTIILRGENLVRTASGFFMQHASRDRVLETIVTPYAIRQHNQ